MQSFISPELKEAILDDLPPLEHQLIRARKHFEEAIHYLVNNDQAKLKEAIPRVQQIYLETIHAIDFYQPSKKHLIPKKDFYYQAALFYYHLIASQKLAITPEFCSQYVLFRERLMTSLSKATEFFDYHNDNFDGLEEEADTLIKEYDAAIHKYQHTVSFKPVESKMNPLETQLATAVKAFEIAQVNLLTNQPVMDIDKVFINAIMAINFYQSETMLNFELIGNFYYHAAQFYFELLKKHNDLKMDYTFACRYPSVEQFFLESVKFAKALSNEMRMLILLNFEQTAKSFIVMLDGKYEKLGNDFYSGPFPKTEFEDHSVLLVPVKNPVISQETLNQIKKFRQLKEASLRKKGGMSDVEIQQALDKEEKDYLQRMKEFPVQPQSESKDKKERQKFSFKSDLRRRVYLYDGKVINDSYSFAKFLQEQKQESIEEGLAENKKLAAPKAAKELMNLVVEIPQERRKPKSKKGKVVNLNPKVPFVDASEKKEEKKPVLPVVVAKPKKKVSFNLDLNKILEIPARSELSVPSPAAVVAEVKKEKPQMDFIRIFKLENDFPVAEFNPGLGLSDFSEARSAEFSLMKTMMKRKPAKGKFKACETAVPSQAFKIMVRDLVSVSEDPTLAAVMAFNKLVQFNKNELRFMTQDPLVSEAKLATTDEEADYNKEQRLFEYGLTPMMYAAMDCRSSEFIDALVKNGANVNDIVLYKENRVRGMNSIEMAAFFGNEAFFVAVDEMKEGFNRVIDKGNWHGFTALMLLCAGDASDKRENIARKLIQKKSDVTVCINEPGFAYDQWSAFDFAIASGNVGCVKVLLESKVNLTRKLNEKFVWEIALSYAPVAVKEAIENMIRAEKGAPGKRSRQAFEISNPEEGAGAAKRARVAEPVVAEQKDAKVAGKRDLSKLEEKDLDDQGPAKRAKTGAQSLGLFQPAGAGAGAGSVKTAANNSR